MISLILIGIIWWFIFLLTIFPQKYISKSPINHNADSAIIVLTGGKGRFEKGYELLNRNISDKLFVSGVYPGVDYKEKIINGFDSDFFKCCIFYGYNARNTQDNAKEVGDWTIDNNINEIFLISSFYHLPRTKIIFEAKNPELKIHLIPSEETIFTKKKISVQIFNFKLILTEYFKIIYTIFFGVR